MGSAAAYWWYKRRAALDVKRKSSWMNSIQPPRSVFREQTCPTARDRSSAGRDVIFHLQGIHRLVQSEESKKYTIPEPENKNPTRESDEPKKPQNRLRTATVCWSDVTII